MMNELALLYEDITSGPELPEVEWTRLRAIEFQDLLRQRIGLYDRLIKLNCVSCPDFEDHVGCLAQAG